MTDHKFKFSKGDRVQTVFNPDNPHYGIVTAVYINRKTPTVVVKTLVQHKVPVIRFWYHEDDLEHSFANVPDWEILEEAK